MRMICTNITMKDVSLLFISLLLLSKICFSTNSCTVKVMAVDTSPKGNIQNNKNIIVKRIYSTIIHRHGDRTPITPLRNEDYWNKQLIDPNTLQKIAIGTQIVSNKIESDDHNDTDDTDINSMKDHPAQGRGPYGKLTQLGLYQMISVGTKIRNDLFDTTILSSSTIDEYGRTFYPSLLYNNNYDVNEEQQCDSTATTTTTGSNMKLQPSNIRVFSTNFLRTIQSVQGFLIGLLDEIENENENDTTTNDNIIPINVRYTNIMIPDPTPRRTIEQGQIEQLLQQRQYIKDQDIQLIPIASKVTSILHPLLALDAHDSEFGIPQQQIFDYNNKSNNSVESIETKPLSFNQLAEVLKCLKVRDLLPNTISNEDYTMLSNHAAWKWYQSWLNPRLRYLSMNPLVTQQIYFLKDFISKRKIQLQLQLQQNEQQNDVSSSACLLTIYSAHDSTLIGLLCAYNLQQPNQWPEYASYILIELLEVTTTTRTTSNTNTDPIIVDYYVRFSLNGQILKCNWVPTRTSTNSTNDYDDMILLSTLEEHIQTVGSTPIDFEIIQ